MSLMQQSLTQLRDEIDSIDEQLQKLLNKRAYCAQQVAEVKQAEACDGETILFYRPERETAVLRKVMERNNGPLSNEEVARLFREIMSACLALELPMQIAFLGPEGTFTQAAALKHFGHSVKTVPFTTIDEVFREVDAGSCQYGVVPVENSTEGVISHTLDMLIESPLKICGEVSLRIHQYLMSKVTDLSSINKIYSHQQSLAQCREWLDRQLPYIERIAVSSNAEAARLTAVETGAAAIGSSAAAEIYKLSIIAENIEDKPDNTTRFIILGKQDVESSCTKTQDTTCFDKTSIMITAANKPGALHRLLKPIADNGLSMSRIESRPSRSGLWQYLFFVDLDGHISQPAVKKALEEIDKEASLLKILGSYPKAVM
jgi:chorismate mutase/prephenate dehydratase